MNPRILGIIGGLALVVALLSPFGMGSSKKVEQLFEAAETLDEQNDYEGAIAKYKEALKESKRLGVKTKAIDEDFTTFVNFKIAMNYVKLAKHKGNSKYYKKALEHVEKAAQTVELAEYEEKLTYLWGYVLYRTGQLEEAAEKLAQLIENFPNSGFVEKAQAIIAQINEQSGGSEEERTKEVGTPTNRIPLWINDLSKFEAFRKKKNKTLITPNRLRVEKQYLKEAEQYEDFANINASTGEIAYALYWSGWCYHKATLEDPAILNKSCIAFQKFVNNHGDSRYIHNAREILHEIAKQYVEQGYSYLDQERLKRATKKARDALDIDPLNENAKSLLKKIKQKYFDQGINYVETEGYDRAIPLLNEVIAIDSQFKEAYCYLGRAHLKLGEFKQAIVSAEKALAIDPNYECAKNIIRSIDIGKN